LKNLEDEKRERREKVIYTVPADSLLYTESWRPYKQKL
jgi:hypothetical protein